MAVYSTDFASPEAVERWSGITEMAVLPATIAGMLVGKGPDSALRVKNETTDAVRGKLVNITYLNIPDVLPIRGRATIEGNESAHQYFNDNIEINVESFAFRSETTLADQFILQDFRKDMKSQVTNAWIEYIDESILNQLGGFTPVQADPSGDIGGADSSFAAGNNPVTAPTTNHHIIANAVADEDTLAAGDNFSADLIEDAVERAETLRTEFDGLPVIREASSPVGMGYICIMSPRQWRHLRDQSGQFLDLVKAEIQGGKKEDNVIRKRFKNKRYQYVGDLDMTKLFVSPYVPHGVTAGGAENALVDRAIFCGAQAGWVVYGRRTPDSNRFMWREEEFSYEQEYGVTARLMWGIKKAVINANDLGVIVLSSHRDLV